MNREQILQQLKEERDRLDRAIEALEGGNTRGARIHSAVRTSGGITAAGRKRLSELMKKRWAERKKKTASSK
ncbi:MAG TPA: hypothetical protein VG897_12790 [Terriglobales bacterium]|nr:hypothetical protein [Terriglobales bacterium]